MSRTGCRCPLRSSAPPAAGLMWMIPAYLGARLCPARSPAGRRLSPFPVLRLPAASRSHRWTVIGSCRPGHARSGHPVVHERGLTHLTTRCRAPGRSFVLSGGPAWQP